MSDTDLANAASVYFGGRRRAEHILRCDTCRHDDAGEFIACPRCPGVDHGRTLHLVRAAGA